MSTMGNYWWEITPEYDQFTVTIGNHNTILTIVDSFNQEIDAEYYAKTYIQGYRDATDAKGEA